MSNDLNHCTFIGRAGKDAETRFLPSGESVANFSIAVGWKGKDKEGVEWVRCSAFGKLAEICGQYITKGKQIYVAGRMSTRKYQDKDGQDKYVTEINVDRMQLLGGGEREEAPKPRTHSEMKAAARGQGADGGRSSAPRTATGFDDMDDDIPFITADFSAERR